MTFHLRRNAWRSAVKINSVKGYFLSPKHRFIETRGKENKQSWRFVWPIQTERKPTNNPNENDIDCLKKDLCISL